MLWVKSSDTHHYENVPFEVPKGWVWTTLEEITSKIGSGSTPKGSNYSEEGIPFFRSQNVYNEGLVYEDIKFISDATHQLMIGTEVHSKDLLLNITGGSLGRCAIVPADFQIGNVSQHVCIIRSILVLSSYVHTFILSPFFKKTMNITGSGREGLPKYNLEKMFLPIPPLKEQERIIKEIEHWFTFIDTIEQSKVNLQTAIKQTKSKILDLAIHGKLVPQDPSDEPASELLKRINPKAQITCDNEHSEKFPQDWEHILIGDYVETVTDFVANGSFASLRENVKYYNEPNYAILVRTKDFQNNFKQDLVYTDPHGYEFLAKSNLFGGELIFSNVGSIGKIFIVPELNQKMTLAPNAIMVRFHNDKQQKWFYYLFLSTIGQNLLDSITSATAIGKFNKTDFKKLSIPIPPLAEQQRIVQKIETLFSVIDNIQEALEVS
ncbi:restriction endonuclease subunit S [Alloprevotella tannerae]